VQLPQNWKNNTHEANNATNSSLSGSWRQQRSNSNRKPGDSLLSARDSAIMIQFFGKARSCFVQTSLWPLKAGSGSGGRGGNGSMFLSRVPAFRHRPTA
jgi:hypothetical protein